MDSSLPALKLAQTMAYAGASFCLALLIFGLPHAARLRGVRSSPNDAAAVAKATKSYWCVATAGSAAFFFWIVAAGAMGMLYFRGW